ncbi:MAG: hypothetical protein NTY13_01865, partial [Chlamydiae bacterium]|nr:hypothetical protein [Chlamydiota bacterium]
MKKKTGLLYFQIKSLVTVTLILSFFRTCYGQTPLENKNKLILEESVGIVKNYQMEDTSWQVEETLDADEKTNREALYKIEAADTEYTPMIGALWQSDERIIERDGCLDVEAADTEYTPMVGALWQSDERIIERDGCLDVEAADTEYTPMVGALWQSDERIIERDGCLDVEAADTEYTPMIGALWQ